MANHIVTYVQRSKITDWKRLTLSRPGAPAFLYGSNDPGVFRCQVQSGSTLWVVSSLPNGWPPELVARLKVTRMAERTDPDLRVAPDLLRHFPFRWIAVGDPEESQYFGHNDASGALLNTVFARKHAAAPLGWPGSSWKPAYGSALQRPALVAEDGSARSGAAFLEQLAQQASISVFISWKWSDHPDRGFILGFAHALAQLGVMAWLDILALPSSRALRVVAHDAVKLEQLLTYGYQHCAAVVAIGTPHYGQQSARSAKNWTLREWTGALTPEKTVQRVVCLLDATRRDLAGAADCVLKNTDPVAAASELRERLISPLGVRHQKKWDTEQTN
jgi:hypothetical protein